MLRKDLSESERMYDNLQEEYIRNRKRLQWFQRKEAEERQEKRQKK